MTTTQGDANHPFACRHTQDFPELLMRCGCSLMITTYQGGKVMMISPQDEDTLVQLPRAFDEPMGLALAGRKLALGTKQELLVFSNEPELAQSYPEKPGVYDAMFFPRRLYFTGQLSMHDLAWGNSGLLGVNTLFSCLCHFDSEHNFTPIWQPPFISELVPEDRCHLNGLALEDGEPRFVTALGETDQARAWSPGRAGGGIVMDLQSGEVITRGLAMPHSPRLHQGWLYVLESATGEVVRIDPQSGEREVIRRLPGFVRGLSIHGEYLFIGLSKLRRGSIGGLDKLPVQEQPMQSGVSVIHLPSGTLAGELVYQNSCDEIYEVLALPGIFRPNVLGMHNTVHRRALSIPGQTFWSEVAEK
jgi:uncharacterized protein (TIGR03032 family)